MGDIFFFFFDDIGTYSKKVMTVTLSLSLMSEILLVILILLASLVPMGGRLLGAFLTKYISKRSVSKLIFFRVLLFFFCELVSLKKLGINLADIEGWL